MKQKDVVVIIVVAFVAATLSLVMTQTLFVSKKKRELTAEVVDPIKSDFQQPDAQVFNSNAINPTQLIQIGDGGDNSTPF